MFGNVCSCHGQAFKNFTGRSAHERFVSIPLSEEHRRKISEALMGNKHRRGKPCSDEAKRRIRESNVKYHAQHRQAKRDFPDPLGPCRVPGCNEEAEKRTRLDHMELPYRPGLVLPMCLPHNSHHNRNGFVVFIDPDPEHVHP